jgi:hypothetical protein
MSLFMETPTPLVGDVGLEPTASGSGDQRSIQLS